MMDAPFHWDRFWFPTGSHISLIDGYLPDPDGWMGPHLDAQGVRLRALVHIPCLILLGVPGMGKTSEMKAAAEAALEAGELVDFISLARLTGPTELQSQLANSAHHTAWQRGSKIWNLYLDGLDEALAQRSQIESAIPDLVRQLAGDTGPIENLRLRISCRSAEWPQSLEAELRGIWDADDIQVYELGHLREGDVKLAVSQLLTASAKQDQFMNYVREHEAQPLASRPVTLNLLLNVFRQEAALPRRQVELYRKGLRANLVVGVGPRIHYEMSTKITPNSKVPVVVMRPGLNKELMRYEADATKLRTPHCLFLARFEDQELKGAGLACRMIYGLNTGWAWPPARRPKLIMRGFDPDPRKFEEEIKAIVGITEAVPYCMSRAYTADVETIASDMRSASALIMPSKREGFGLTALEGIAAGIPTLISAESGLAALLLENDVVTVIDQAVADACVAEVDGDAGKIATDWATRMQEILFDPAKAFLQAKQMRSALAPILSWERAAEQLSQDIEDIL